MSKRGKVLKGLKEAFINLNISLAQVKKLPKEDKEWVSKRLEKWDEIEEFTNKLEELAIELEPQEPEPDDDDDLPF